MEEGKISQLSASPDSERKGADNNEEGKKDGGQIYSRNCTTRICKENIQTPRPRDSYYEFTIFYLGGFL